MFNTRKRNQKVGRPRLLNDPHGWLQEICGSLNLMNRCDLRLGMDYLDHNQEIKVINGVWRGEDMPALLVRSVPCDDGVRWFRSGARRRDGVGSSADTEAA